MAETTSDNGKTIGIIAYLTLIGWIIAFVMHNNNKTELGAFHLRQMLGIMILGIVLNIVGTFSGVQIIGWILWAFALVLWILGLMGALQGEKKEIPIVGEHFQNWFKGIG